jgi:hypothetical protein
LQRRRRENFDPCRGELDGQRQAIEPATDLGHCRSDLSGQRQIGFDSLRSIDEEPDRFRGDCLLRRGCHFWYRERKRWHRVLALSGDAQPDPTGNENLETRARAE